MAKERELQTDDQGYKGYWVTADNGEHFFIREEETARQAWGRHMQGKDKKAGRTGKTGKFKKNDELDKNNNLEEDELKKPDYAEEVKRMVDLGYERLGYDKDKRYIAGIDQAKYKHDLFLSPRNKENEIVGGMEYDEDEYEKRLRMTPKERKLYDYKKWKERTYTKNRYIPVYDNRGPMDPDTPLGMSSIQYGLWKAENDKEIKFYQDALKRYEEYYSGKGATYYIDRVEMEKRLKNKNKNN